MTNDTPASVEEYMTTIPEHARANMERLRQTIKAAAPEAREAISYKMPTFQQDGLVVAYSAHKKHYSLHAVSGGRDPGDLQGQAVPVRHDQGQHSL